MSLPTLSEIETAAEVVYREYITSAVPPTSLEGTGGLAAGTEG